MRVCVTGGGGYLGTTLVRALIDARHTVTVLDRFDWGTQPLLSAVGRSSKQVTVYRGEIHHAGLLADALDGADAVIHLAGIVGYPACDANPIEADRTNVEGTRAVCAAVAGRPLFFASTGSTYGKLEGRIALERHPVCPLTRYGRNKAEAEALVARVGGVTFRLATLFGTSPRMRWDLLPHDFARSAATTGRIDLYEGHARRTFLHVKDAANAFVLGLRAGLPSGVYNVGRTLGNVTKLDVARVVEGLTGCQIAEMLGSDPDQRDYAVGFGKIRDALPKWAIPLPPKEQELPVALGDVVKWARCWR
jgi:nucleoside-diphosphate-sugar epimerase